MERARQMGFFVDALEDDDEEERGEEGSCQWGATCENNIEIWLNRRSS